MLSTRETTPSTTSVDRQARVQALSERLLPLVQQTARDMAEQLADLPDEQLFGQIEFTLRDQAHQLASAAHQAGIDVRQKKTATTVPASSATTAATTPSSSTT
jgi:hypothetical protein